MEKCVFIGYSAGYKSWLFYNPTTKKTIISERAEFDEHHFPGLSKSKSPLPLSPSAEGVVEFPVLDDEREDQTPSSTFHESTPSLSTPPSCPSSPDAKHASVHFPQPNNPTGSPSPHPHADAPPAPPPALRCGTRPRNMSGEWWKVFKPLVLPSLPDSDLDSDAEAGFVEVQFAGTTSVADPRTYKQAMQGPDAAKWHKAAQDEFMSLENNGTWELVDLPPGAKAIDSGWAFMVKHNADGSVECYKARLVTKGFSQCSGIDYNEVFAPTFRPAALRVIYCPCWY